MTKKVEQVVNEHAEIYALGSQISRSTVAVIDALTGRGAFKGEELTTIGQLRDQCLQAIQLAEHNQQEQMAQSD
jgi:GAF domain-containing protein